jgi:hypothetical protein
VSDNETAVELAKLRADVAALSEARTVAAEKPTQSPPVEEVPAVVTETAGAESRVTDETKSQMEELGDLLQAEIRDLPTITCLTVFSLGILMGRLMR